MAQERLPMHKIRDVLRLKAAGLSKRQIAASVGIGPTAVGECLRRAREAGLAWPLADDQPEAVLEARLYPPVVALSERPLPDWAAIHIELKRKGVTLLLVWEEYRSVHPDGYSRSRFCELYRDWLKRGTPTMRQTHVGGEKLFVDYAGTTLDVVDADTGEVRKAQLFVAALGASSYTYAEATWTQTLPDWIGAHTRAFTFFGGVPAMIVSDNLKSGITKACFHEPQINRAYAEMAAHHDTAVVPARPVKPRDKAIVEVAVQIATRWIAAKIRKRTFFSLAELNVAVRECLVQLNDRVSRHLGASRRALFDALDRPALKSLPTEAFAYAEWQQTSVGQDYHVEVDKHFYSVPYTLVREALWVRLTATTIEAFHRGSRVAAHVRREPPAANTVVRKGHTTLPEHMPSSHRRYAEWTPDKLAAKAAEIGPQTVALIEIVLREKTHPEQGFRASIGILDHARNFGSERLEAACARAIEIGARSYSSVTSILKNNLDRRRPQSATDGPVIVHANIRGPRYFH
jgi:transposase